MGCPALLPLSWGLFLNTGVFLHEPSRGLEAHPEPPCLRRAVTPRRPGAAPGSGPAPVRTSVCLTRGAATGSVTAGTAVTRRRVRAGVPWGAEGEQTSQGAPAGCFCEVREPARPHPRQARNPSSPIGGSLSTREPLLRGVRGWVFAGWPTKAGRRPPGAPEKCQSAEFQCRSSACLSLSRVCDGKEDCADGSDEGGQCSSACSQARCPHACFQTPRGPVSASVCSLAAL